MGKISIVGLDKADVLAALFNASKAQGTGFIHYDPSPMTKETAAQLLKETTSFDYIQGRIMKVDLSENEFDPSLYNRDNGQSAAEKVITELRNTDETT